MINIDKDLIMEFDLNTYSYEFHIISIFLTDDNKLFYAEDSGGSCRDPYKDFTQEDFKELTDFHSFSQDVMQIYNENQEDRHYLHPGEFLDKVRQYMLDMKKEV